MKISYNIKKFLKSDNRYNSYFSFIATNADWSVTSSVFSIRTTGKETNFYIGVYDKDDEFNRSLLCAKNILKEFQKFLDKFIYCREVYLDSIKNKDVTFKKIYNKKFFLISDKKDRTYMQSSININCSEYDDRLCKIVLSDGFAITIIFFSVLNKKEYNKCLYDLKSIIDGLTNWISYSEKIREECPSGLWRRS